MGELISNIKEFIWDIIGYIIPGFVFIIIFNFVINPSIGIYHNFLFEWKLFDSYLVIIISYVLGYLIYSLTIFKIRNQDFLISKLENLFNHFFINGKNLTQKKLEKRVSIFNKYIKSKHSEYWELKFKKSATIESAKQFLKEKGYSNVDKMKLHEIRNILMSRNPEMDEKVYTFMFRASMFDHLSTIFILTCFLIIIQTLLNLLNFDVHFMKIENTFITFYLILFLFVPLLGNCKRMFYSISRRIPNSNLK